MGLKPGTRCAIGSFTSEYKRSIRKQDRNPQDLLIAMGSQIQDENGSSNLNNGHSDCLDLEAFLP